MISRFLIVALTALLVLPLGLSTPHADAKKKSKTVTRQFENTQTLNILSFQTRSSEIKVKGFKKGKITDVNVTLEGFSHELPGPVSFLLVAPDGRNIIPLSDVTANNTMNATLTFDDEANDELDQDGPLTSGTYKPVNFGNDTNSDFNPMDTPAPSGDVALSTFDGINPNGAWTLFVYNANASNPGKLDGGWSLQIKAKAQK